MTNMTPQKIIPSFGETVFLMDLHEKLHGPAPHIREMFTSSVSLLDFWTKVAKNAMDGLECHVLKSVLCTNSPLDDPLISINRAMKEAKFNHPFYDHLVSQILLREDLICQHYSHKFPHVTSTRNKNGVMKLRRKKKYRFGYREQKYIHDMFPPIESPMVHYLLREPEQTCTPVKEVVIEFV